MHEKLEKSHFLSKPPLLLFYFQVNELPKQTKSHFLSKPPLFLFYFQVKNHRDNLTSIAISKPIGKAASCGDNTVKVHELHGNFYLSKNNKI
jgi:hypothetical protein